MGAKIESFLYLHTLREQLCMERRCLQQVNALWTGSAGSNLKPVMSGGCNSWMGKEKWGRNAQGKARLWHLYPLPVPSAGAAASPRVCRAVQDCQAGVGNQHSLAVGLCSRSDKYEGLAHTDLLSLSLGLTSPCSFSLAILNTSK